MKKLALSLLLFGASAFATPVAYTTTGVFASDSTNTITNGDATITFAGTSGSVSAPTFSSLGTFTVTGTVGGTFSDTFTLTISQTIPAAGNGTSTSKVNGTISGNSSGILLSFVPPAVVIGSGAQQVTYTFSPETYGLNNPAVNSGKTTIEAYITAAPEPASLGLFGGSLLGIALIVRRVRVKN